MHSLEGREEDSGQLGISEDQLSGESQAFIHYQWEQGLFQHLWRVIETFLNKTKQL